MEDDDAASDEGPDHTGLGGVGRVGVRESGVYDSDLDSSVEAEDDVVESGEGGCEGEEEDCGESAESGEEGRDHLVRVVHASVEVDEGNADRGGEEEEGHEEALWDRARELEPTSGAVRVRGFGSFDLNRPRRRGDGSSGGGGSLSSLSVSQ